MIADRGIDALREAIDEVAEALPAASGLPPGARSEAGSRDLSLQPPWRRLTQVAALAAVLVLICAAYLGWLVLPRWQVSSRTASVVAGPANLQLVSMPRQGEVLRGGGEADVETLEMRTGQPLMLLVELDPDLAMTGVEGVRFELGPQSAPDFPWSWPLTIAELQHHLEVHEGVPLVLPVSELAPGDYVLRVQLEGSTGGDELIRRLRLVNGG